MATPQSPKVSAARPRARKSIAHMPSPDISGDKENLTIDSAGILSLTTSKRPTGRESRSKSIGPGGLDALKGNAGNRRAVGYFKSARCKCSIY